MKENVTKRWQEFQFSPSEFYFWAHALRICDNAKDCTSRSVRHFLFLSSVLKSCFLWQCYWCELGCHKENFVNVSACQSAWFWLCKTVLFPRFVKCLIKLHVAKVAVGILHLNFVQLAPGQSTSFKLVDHSPTHNFSTQRARPYILMTLNVHWCISEHTHWLVSSDARMLPAWRNWLIFRDAYYAYILVHLVLACTVLFSFSPPLFFRFSCLLFFFLLLGI